MGIHRTAKFHDVPPAFSLVLFHFGDAVFIRTDDLCCDRLDDPVQHLRNLPVS
jgi:hypothetical protein